MKNIANMFNLSAQHKFNRLKKILQKLGSVVIAFSGGVDSTFLVKVSRDTLGAENVLAVTAKSEIYPEFEFKEAEKLAKELDINWQKIKSEVFKIKEFRMNPVDRCYYCKRELFTKLKKIAAEKGYRYVIDGTNYDDTKDYRPGRKAAREIGVISPLKLAKLTKDDIRRLSRKIGLSIWAKPSLSCLASRVPFGENINITKLKRIQRAEEFLKKLNLSQIRVRCHQGYIARIETDKKDFKKILNNSDAIVKKFKKLGFKYIALDIEGYRTGSLNETLPL